MQKHNKISVTSMNIHIKGPARLSAIIDFQSCNVSFSGKGQDLMQSSYIFC